MILEMLIISIVLGLANSTIILALWDWKVMEWLQSRSPNKFFYKLASCMFCQGFWISVLEVAVIFIFYNNISLIIAPFISASIIRKMVI